MKKIVYEVSGALQFAYCQTADDVAGYLSAYPQSEVFDLTSEEQARLDAYIASDGNTPLPADQ